MLGVLPLPAVADAPAAASKPIAVELPPAEREVDFTADMLPLLQHNCLACHNASTAEGDVVLETPELLCARAMMAPGSAGES